MDSSRKADFIGLIRQHQRLINSVCAAWYRNEEDLKDLRQDIILQLWKSFPSFRGDSHGGAIGILTAVFIYCRKREGSFLWIMDRLAVVSAFTGGVIRLGNLMNSEMIGKAASVPWAFVFVRIDQVPRHPAQLYESLCYFLIFFLLFRLWKARRAKMRPGFLSGWFLVLLFSCRFIIEFFKIDQSAFEAGMPLNMGQLLSIPFILLGLRLMQY